MSKEMGKVYPVADKNLICCVWPEFRLVRLMQVHQPKDKPGLFPELVNAELHQTNNDHDAMIDRFIAIVSLAIAGYCKRSSRGVRMLKRQVNRVE